MFHPTVGRGTKNGENIVWNFFVEKGQKGYLFLLKLSLLKWYPGVLFLINSCNPLVGHGYKTSILVKFVKKG